MPIVEITLIEGRTYEDKSRLVAAVTEAIVSSIKAPREAVRIIIREVPAHHFAAGGVLKGAPPKPS
ncbi:2-hydroxymuconate tautomerase [Methylocella tundrae]|jgi:4-oxalocrotonate tautomerase|uniref:Tautomerase n=1 Tax=Methylocella tundrae TaxID=227605 RepID=A0A4U8Z5Z6_METTU|nr:2-hydroxymuconate tautomerase [Methylocella tundrae]WPP04410.1 2-hydroxymuconate tautomerase [Methylocella tundrae]VFU10771.1 putative enzyme [Methylocella tundrae]